MKKLEFWKMSGAGNDFVVLDNRRGTFPKAVSAWARRLCDRHEGVGADGLLLLEKSRNGAAFRMAYYNADGSRASMCGNGARCIAWFARAHGVTAARFDFDTDAGRVQASVQKGIIEISMGAAFDYRPDLRLKAEGKTYTVSHINTGVPHAVLFVSDLEKVDIGRLGPALRYHRAFRKAGANVNFVQRVNGRTLKVRTYERGVEGETLACGTGVTASAIVAGLKRKVKAPVRCITRGGDTLEVRFDTRSGDTKQPAKHVLLRGPVRVAFKGEWNV